jgi:hypothetical protein
MNQPILLCHSFTRTELWYRDCCHGGKKGGTEEATRRGEVLANVMTRAEACRGAQSYGDKGRFGHLRQVLLDTNILLCADCYQTVTTPGYGYESYASVRVNKHSVAFLLPTPLQSPGSIALLHRNMLIEMNSPQNTDNFPNVFCYYGRS